MREYYKLNALEASYTFVDYIPVEQNSCEAPIEEEVSFGERIKDFGETSADIAMGTGKGLYDVGKDTVVGVFDMVTNPVDTFNSTVEAVKHFDQTYHAIESAISESYEQDVINGKIKRNIKKQIREL